MVDMHSEAACTSIVCNLCMFYDTCTFCVMLHQIRKTDFTHAQNTKMHKQILVAREVVKRGVREHKKAGNMHHSLVTEPQC